MYQSGAPLIFLKKMDRQFKGIWIPADVWLNKSLTLIDKVILAEVDSFTGNGKSYFKSNSKLAEETGLGVSTISRSVKKLIDLGLVKSNFDGRHRHLRTVCLINDTIQPCQIEEADLSKVPTTYTTTKTVTNTITKGGDGIVLPYGSKEFADLWDVWKQERKAKRIKKYTILGEKSILHQLQKDSNNDEAIAIEIIKQSITQGWQGLFPLKKKKNEKGFNKKAIDFGKLHSHISRLGEDKAG